jgi:hypothetical protein
MHVHRAGGLGRRHVTATRQRALAEHWLLTQRVIGHSGEDIQLVLRLERQEDPRSRRMEIQMPRSKADALSRRNRRAIRELAIVIAKHLDRPRVFCRRCGRLIATRDEDDAVIRWQHADLMRVNANIQAFGLGNFATDGAIGVDCMNGQAARIVVGDQQVTAWPIAADVNRPRSQ